MMTDSFRKNDKSGVVSLRGLVSPASWDERGAVASVCLVGDDEKYYFLRFKGSDVDVTTYLKSYVEATGRMEREGRNLYLNVETIRRHPDPARSADDND